MNSDKSIKQRKLSLAQKVVASIGILCLLSIIFSQKGSWYFLQRNAIHIMLSLNMGSDYITYNELSEVGNRTSVPYLINELKKYPSDNHSDRMHRSILLSGLHRITNNHPGDKYEAWKKWWELYKSKSTKEWILLSLKIEGYNVSGYPDDTSLSEIINSMAFKEPVQKEYFLKNVASLMLKQPTSKVIELIRKKVARDQSYKSQLGSARALESIKTSETIPMLEVLSENVNQDVKTVALGALNTIYREQHKGNLKQNVKDVAINIGQFIEDVSMSADHNSLFVVRTSAANGLRSSIIMKVNLRTGDFLWTYNCPAEVGSKLVVHNNNIIYYAYGGTVNCIDAFTGKFKWQAQTEGTTYHVDREVIAVGDTVFAGPEDYVSAFDIETGKTKWKIKVLPARLCASSDNIFVATRDAKLLKISFKGEVASKTDIGGWPYDVEADNGIVYVTYESEPVYLKAFSSKNLTPLFKAFIGDKFVISSIAGINDKIVILRYGSWIKAFDRKKGLQVWAVNEKDRFTIEMNSDVFAVNDELRNPMSGETFYKYNMKLDLSGNTHMFKHLYTISTYSGKLHILEIPKFVESH